MTENETAGLKDCSAAIQFAMEEAVANERATIAAMLKKLEGCFWYPMAAPSLKEIRERVGL